ncbi:MAG: DUF2118 domain-containing protein [Bacteroidia bacterium]
MAEIIRMPRLSEIIKEGSIIAWHKRVGDRVSNGDMIAEVETDKADLEIVSATDGFVMYLCGEVGSVIPSGAVIAVIGGKGEVFSPKMIEYDEI